MNDVLALKPIPKRGLPEDYYVNNGWVDLELADLHPIAASSLNVEYDEVVGMQVLYAASRFYRAATLSLIFKGLDNGLPPSVSEVAKALNAEGIQKNNSRTPWTTENVRRMLDRTGTYRDFLSYRVESNEAFMGWVKDSTTGFGGLTWMRAPATLDDG